MKSVTVIIPTYNRWPVVCSSIDSVLKQSYQNTECMVVDDASSDKTVLHLKSKYGKQIKIVSNPTNKGQSHCRNIGAEISKSDCICFLDSDDLLKHDAIEKRISFFNTNKDNTVVSFGVMRTSEMKQHPLLRKKKLGEELTLTEYLDNHSWCNNNGFLMDRKTFLRDGRYNEKLRNKEDVELLLRLLHRHTFYFCGSDIGEVRNVSNKRARNDYEKILSQSTLFSKTILENSQLKKTLGQDIIHKIISTDIEESLRALFKLGNYKEYRTLYKQAVKDDYINNRKRFFKRYLVSFIK